MHSLPMRTHLSRTVLLNAACVQSWSECEHSYLTGSLQKQLWAERVCHVTTLINTTPSSKTDGRILYELWYRRIPSMTYMKVSDAVHMYTSRNSIMTSLMFEHGCARTLAYRVTRTANANFAEEPTCKYNRPRTCTGSSCRRAPATTPAAGSIAAVPHRLPSIREAHDRNEMHYPFRTEAKYDSSSPLLASGPVSLTMTRKTPSTVGKISMNRSSVDNYYTHY
ncbi:Retrotransposon protein, unclassified [Phytophthora palmivora]|uniref:Retrotransposon protein, unclassified n=1 Tax=Phytophthora palmivora TaxID=4796 RepID=A0A2P4XMI4_9STRA|nr:Retrotransposon protein, unclassified [Phytophthora palmivora]